MHCFAGIVEELQRTAYLLAVAFLDREAVRPNFGEDSKVDVGAEHDCAVVARMNLVVDADLLVDRALVARQRHDFANSLKPKQEIVHARLDALHPVAAMRGDKLGFRNAKLCREVALAHLGVFGASDANLMRRRFDVLVHVKFACLLGCYLLRMSLPWRVIFRR